MGQFWTRKNDNKDKDKRTANPWMIDSTNQESAVDGFNIYNLGRKQVEEKQVFQIEAPLPQFKNIFFDLGGVLFNLNTKEAFRKFAEFGMPVPKDILESNSPLNGGKSKVMILEMVHKHDIGEINGDDFINLIKSYLRPEITREQILEAYNGQIDVPVGRLELLERLRKTYKVFLLSNIGDIHWKAARLMMADKGYPAEDIFDHCFCSFQMHVAKPDMEIFRRAIMESGVNPEETLYIDDAPANIEAGKKAGLISYLIEPNSLEQHISTLFPNL